MPQHGETGELPDVDDVVRSLTFDERGLVPAIIQDVSSREVLMLAWMNSDSIRASLTEQRTVFWSRSRQELWRKGETSGHVQRIVEFRADCDADALLVLVEQTGPACHTGAQSCFDVHQAEESEGA